MRVGADPMYAVAMAPAIAHVCRYWHTTAHEHSRPWSNVVLHMGARCPGHLHPRRTEQLISCRKVP
ncbi:hypothetical protein EI94DRAFT_1217669 [Lactarius quietus]|nr:hypothetical protein EI94DRAFT_1217669 [Lactarius quietus]